VAGLLAGLILSLSVGLSAVTFFYWEAARSAQLTRQSLYRAQMNLAAEYLMNGDIAGVKQMLDRVLSNPRSARLRGVEWQYYDALTALFAQIASHGDDVRDVAISPDGNVFASIGGPVPTIRLWSARTGEMMRELSLKAGGFGAIAFSPTGGHLASGSDDGLVRIWEPLKNDEPIRQMEHGPPVAFVRFSPDGKLLLSSGISGAVRLWDEKSKTPVAEIPAGKSGARDARFSPDGKTVAVASGDHRVRLWDVKTGSIVGQPIPNPSVESLAFSDDGGTIATGSSGGVIRIWSAADRTLRYKHEAAMGRIGDIEFLKESPLLAILASDGRLHMYDTDRQCEIHSLKTHSLSGGVLARSENGESLVVGSGDGSVKLLNVDDVTQPNVFWHQTHVRRVAFLADGGQLVAASGDGALRTWDVQTGESRQLSDATGQEITTVSAQRPGNLIAAAGVAPRFALWNWESGRVIHEIDVPHAKIAVVAFSSSGRRLAVATSRGGIFLYEPGDWTTPRLKTAPRQAAVQSLTFSPDDRDIVVGYDDGEVHFFDAAGGTRQDHSIHVSAIPRALAFCESGALLAIGTDAGEIYLYDVAAQSTRSIIKAHTSRINALAPHPDGTTLVSGGRDRELRLWDTTSGELLTRLLGHRKQIFSIAVSPDGRTIASGGLEGDIRIWRTQPVR
jgi:WD40 repeat protein